MDAIDLFRREMKKWHTVLWIVLMSMVLSSLSMVFFKSNSPHEMVIARVNRQKVYAKDFQRSYGQVTAQIEQLKSYASTYKIDPKLFVTTMLGGMEPAEYALWSLIRETVADQAAQQLALVRNDAWFAEQLLRSLPGHLLNREGGIELDAYARFTAQLGLTPQQFEALRKKEMERQELEKLVQSATYLPASIGQHLIAQQQMQKKFAIMAIPHKTFMPDNAQKEVLAQRAEEYYARHAEAYRTPEQRAARYAILTPDTKIAGLASAPISDQDINTFYQRNKSKLFRVPVKVQVRRLLLKTTKEGGLETKVVQKRAEELRDLIIKQPSEFAAIARQYSQDEKTAKKGGLLEPFSKGASSHDTAFQKAAFALKEEGQVSGVIKTAEGFQIIQLVERIKATEKELSDVRDEIQTTLAARRQGAQIKGMLEQFVRGADQQEALATFVSNNGLTLKQTELTSQDKLPAGATALEVELIKRLFASKKKEGQCGYFAHENNYCVYEVSKVVPSAVPALDKVRDRVLDAMANDHAYEKAKTFVQETKANLLDGKTSLQKLSDTHKFDITQTDFVPVQGSDSNLAKLKLNQGALWGLTDAAQVLVIPGKNRHYVVQLIDQKQVNDAKMTKNTVKRIEQEHKGLTKAVFFASLMRRATIDLDKNFANIQATVKE